MELKDRHPKNADIAKTHGYDRHQYLEDVMPLKKCGVNFMDNKDDRYPVWMLQRKLYGFDVRETWNLDVIFCEWLYEHVMAYKEVTIVNMDNPTFEIGPKKYTMREAIDELLRCLKYLIKHEYAYDKSVLEKYNKRFRRAMKIWMEICPAMWW